MKYLFILLLHFICLKGISQVNGGEHIFEFLKLPQSPHITAMGGFTVANPSSDLMLSLANPALLRPEFHTNIGLNYNLYYATTRVSNMMYAHHVKKINTTFALGVQYIDYGKIITTDNIGNSLSEEKAADYAITISAAKPYLEKWNAGIALKYASSNLIQYNAAAILTDIGLVYADTNKKLFVGFVIKNAGFQLKHYDKNIGAQPLPIDVQIGVVKKFKKAPFSLSALAHHLYTWDVRYDNPADRIDNTLLFNTDNQPEKTKTYFADKLFRHFVFSFDMHLAKRVEISVGYNHMRRAELSIISKKGLSGFSFGAGIYLNKFIIHFAQSYYHLVGAYNEVGINMALNQLFGIGNFGKKINWSEKFESKY